METGASFIDWAWTLQTGDATLRTLIGGSATANITKQIYEVQSPPNQDGIFIVHSFAESPDRSMGLVNGTYYHSIYEQSWKTSGVKNVWDRIKALLLFELTETDEAGAVRITLRGADWVSDEGSASTVPMRHWQSVWNVRYHSTRDMEAFRTR